jgi:hypothetical protein
MVKKGSRFSFGFLVFFICLFSFSIQSEPQTFIKQEKTPEGISYLTGGVGKDERDSLSKMGKDYNLKLVFAHAKGPYLANVEVHIKDSNGKKVIEAISDGPWFYAKLPQGTYTISAKAMGKSYHQKADIPEKGQVVLNFFWKE